MTPVLFVGAGPGDPDLITVAGRNALAEADLVIHAGSLVNPALLDWARPEARRVDSAPLTLSEIVDLMAQGYETGRKVVRLHTGDPSLYGAIHEQLTALKARGVPARIIPGVTSALAAAAGLGLEFTLPEITQTLIITRAAGRTPVPEGENLAALAAIGASLALYLSAGQGEEAGRALSLGYGPEAPLALSYRATWPDARLVWTTCGQLAETLKAEGLDRHTLILAGPAIAALRGQGPAPASRLYDPGFSHGHRAAKDPCG
ncbi:MAG: precorrin-4 C(11)-methyltransferase [Candidatus Adiutrix sp.]|jgi:precorrin-4/cobalt-precorrin-4 C11-methyltransferase|nr:precorrin-4 C(11)-methyltransferase [Candidatus Adiutrix sp.]